MSLAQKVFERGYNSWKETLTATPAQKVFERGNFHQQLNISMSQSSCGKTLLGVFSNFHNEIIRAQVFKAINIANEMIKILSCDLVTKYFLLQKFE